MNIKKYFLSFFLIGFSLLGFSNPIGAGASVSGAGAGGVTAGSAAVGVSAGAAVGAAALTAGIGGLVFRGISGAGGAAAETESAQALTQSLINTPVGVSQPVVNTISTVTEVTSQAISGLINLTAAHGTTAVHHATTSHH